MKKKFIYVSLFMTLSVFTLSSCGNSSESETSSTEKTETSGKDSTEVAGKFDENSFASADEAMEQYKTLLEEYADLVKSGSTEEAEALKAQMEELKSFSEGKWGAASLEAMANLSKYALDIESGKDINLDDALNAYDKSLDAIKNMPGMDAESEKAIEDAQDAMNQLESLGM
jgi:hypothetical protein